MRFQGNLKIAAIAALGVMLLAVIAGAVVFALTAVQSTTEDTPVDVVGQTAGAAVGPVTAMGAVASSPLDAEPAAASSAPPLVASVSGTRSANGQQIAVSWTAAANATHYSLNYFVHDGNTQWFRYTDDITTTSFTMTGLQPKKAYTLAVQSVRRETGDDGKDVDCRPICIHI